MKQYILFFPLILLILLNLKTDCFSTPDSSTIFSVNVNDRQLSFVKNGALQSIKVNKRFLNQNYFCGSSESDPILVCNAFSTNDHITVNSDSILFNHTLSETDSTSIITFTETSSVNGVEMYRITKQYIVNKYNYLIKLSATISKYNIKDRSSTDPISLHCTFINTDNDLKFVTINKKKKNIRTSGSLQSETLSQNAWKGIRNRFQALIFTCYDSAQYSFTSSEKSFSINNKSTPDSLSVTFYCGPVIYKDLLKAGSECTHLLFPLWFWMRWLSLGLMHLFDILLSTLDNVVLSIIVLSICVKIIIAPLFFIADRWQQQVNRENSILQPKLAEIKSKFKGEEQTQKILALHKESGISPLYSLKSLGSAAIQIPIFFAAYHALSEHYSLCHVSFLWMKDLAFPDHAFLLPFTIPILGKYLNILPFVMTSITFASSWLHHDASLSTELRKSQRNNLYFMALLFFILLYTSPAGMVLYWTMNNFLAFLSSFYHKVKHFKKTVSAGKIFS